MAFLTLDKEKLRHNFKYLSKEFGKRNIEWGVVTKLLCGNKDYLKLIIDLGIKEIHDSRISNLKKVKKLDETVQTVYIKPPAKRSIKSVVSYADVSFNTEYTTIKMLSDEAVEQDKKHRILIMIELGDLREGVIGENLLEFYGKVFELPNIEIVGLGTNLNCLHGVLPSPDKLVQLGLYKQLLEVKFNRKIAWISGGTSVVLPLMFQKMLPRGVNHFRVGETLFFGNNLYSQEPIKKMKQDVFKLHTEIIELTEKPKVPMGNMGQNVAGEEADIKEEDYGKKSYRAIIDVGLLDIAPDHLKPVDTNIEFSGASSDMLVLDLGDNKNNYKVGDLIEFDLKYMGALSLLNSNYIGKKIK